MQFGLVSFAPDQLAARSLHQRLERVMPGHPVRLFGAVDELPPLAAALWICLADGSGLDQACLLCARISAAAPAATVLAAGWEGVHSGLKALLDVGASDLLYLPASDHESAFRQRHRRRHAGLEQQRVAARVVPRDPPQRADGVGKSKRSAPARGGAVGPP
jgi:hypothetical protein